MFKVIWVIISITGDSSGYYSKISIPEAMAGNNKQDCMTNAPAITESYRQEMGGEDKYTSWKCESIDSQSILNAIGKR